MMAMEYLEATYTLFKQGQSLKVKFLINGKRYFVPKITNLNIADIAQVRFKFEFAVESRNRIPTTSVKMSMSCKRCESAIDYAVKLNIKVQNINDSQQFVCPADWTEWIEVGVIGNLRISNVAGSVVVEVDMSASKAEVLTFAKLYNDTITTDINLSARGSNNVVPMHRNCLLAHSDFFKALFQSGDFVDKKDFVFGQKDITEQTIHDLKDYVYLGVLPDAALTGLLPLLLLARCYLFDNLMSECIVEIAQTVTPENLHDLMRFACENNMPELGMALLQTPHEVSHQAYLLSKKAQKRTHEEDSEIPKKRQRTDNDVE